MLQKTLYYMHNSFNINKRGKRRGTIYMHIHVINVLPDQSKHMVKIQIYEKYEQLTK